MIGRLSKLPIQGQKQAVSRTLHSVHNSTQWTKSENQVILSETYHKQNSNKLKNIRLVYILTIVLSCIYNHVT